MKKLDIIVPVRNEEGNILEFCRRVDVAMKASKTPYQIILVVDPSTDKTLEVSQEVAKKYSVLVHEKQGKTGKAYSVIEGINVSTSDYLAMIDGDLQYPPEALPEMLQKISENPEVGVVVAHRKKQQVSTVRKFGSKLNHYLFNNLILGYKVDVQSGLKIFRREIVPHFIKTDVKPWTIDAEILHAASELGFKISEVDIEFFARTQGVSKVNFIPTAISIATESLKIRLRKRGVYHIPPTNPGVMTGAGVAFKKKRFITHSTLPHNTSALETFATWQKLFLISVFCLFVAALVINFTATIIGFIAILSLVYFIDVIFTTFLVLKSLHFPPELTFTDIELGSINDKELPVYSILCPLYKEASVLPQFVENIDRFDYPREKLDVLILLEEDDLATIEAAKKLPKRDYLRIVIVPQSMPKTKPKASNYGLSLAKGEFVVVYDAEDQPDPLQLKKAVVGFSKVPKNVACLQAKLNYYNPGDNILTRLFTAEYSLWFDLVLPALQSIDTTIPLGGTSNHFRRTELIALHGWDGFNVTEDCDLGARLFKEGKKTAIIDSVTLEEANSDLKNWFRQRSRWIKGYFQTYLIHMRNPVLLTKQLGWHALIFQLVIGARTTFMLINPILWVATILYFSLYSIVGPTIESFYPTPVFYLAVFSLAFGNFVYLYNYMIGCAKRGQWELVKFVFLVPVYWLFVSYAALKALVQLILKPHYWEKTNHGLHLKNNVAVASAQEVKVAPEKKQHKILLPHFITSHPLLLSGGILVGASLLSNFLFLLSSTFLARQSVISFEIIGVLGLLGSILTIFDVFSASFGKTVSYQAAYLFGKYEAIVKGTWKKGIRLALVVGAVLAIIFTLAVPALSQVSHTPTWPLYLFVPVLLVGVLNATNNGFLLGSQKFVVLAFVLVIEALTKLLVSVGVVQLGRPDLIYTALPISVLVSFIVGLIIINFIKNGATPSKEESKLPYKFFLSSVGIKVSMILFFGIDIILAKYLLSPTAAGQYVLLTSVGKMVFIFGGLFTQFINPLVAKREGEKKDSKKEFKSILVLTILFSTLIAIILGPLGSIVVPQIFGAKSLAIVPYLIPYSIAMATLAVSGAIVNYHQVKKHYFFAVIGIIFAILQGALILSIGTSVSGIVTAVTVSAAAYLFTTVILHLAYGVLVDSKNNLWDLANLFLPIQEGEEKKAGKQAILIFNWRDTRHAWAGGAEVYIQELAKRWVQDGNKVTIFCGHDGKSPRNEIIDGVSIVRRGGFSFVYIWAAVYYLLRFRGRYDTIVDCENGIPFFTPLFAKEKVFLLIHHIHQEVFRDSFALPKYLLATFLEQKAMPFVYRNIQIITVSESSKKEIMDHKITKIEPIVIYNGVDLDFYKPAKKSEIPNVLYVGRIKKHKSLEVFIRMAKNILEEIPSVQFTIAGDGPDKQPLLDFAKSLGLEGKINFTGRVSEEEKRKLYQKAWVFVNPSMMEGWGITSIEANACGTPVVASNVPGLRDSVDNPHTGFLVPYNNDERFADRVLSLINNKRFREQTNKYARKWAEKFNWDRSAEEFMEVIKQ